MTREAALAAITAEAEVSTKSSSVTAAVASRAVLDDTAPFSEGERSLLIEWLDRLAETTIT
jgi:hypothetical protein